MTNTNSAGKSGSHHATLAIDIGTHSVRAAAVDARGDILYIATRGVTLNKDPETQFIEQDGSDIVAKAQQVIADVAGHPFEFTSAGLAIQRSTVIAWDAETGNPMYPAISWQDTRARDFVSNLLPHIEQIRDKSGLVLSPHYGASKIRWLKRKFEQRAEGQRILIAPLVSFVLFHLLDGSPYLCDESNAARTQLWDLNERGWSETLCRFFEVNNEVLPRVVPVIGEYGTIRHTHIPLVAVCGDQNAAYYAQRQKITKQRGKISGSAVVNLGTGAFVLTEVGAEARTGNLLKSLAYSTGDECHYLLEATINGAGSALEWAFDRWQNEKTAAGITANTGRNDFFNRLGRWWEMHRDPPVFINAIGGVGSPFWYSRLQPSFLNNDDDTTDWEAKTVAILESILFLLVINLEVFKSLGNTLESLYCSGGLSKTDSFCQNLANLSGMEVVRVEQAEATVAGVAILARSGEDDHCNVSGGTCDIFLPSSESSGMSGFYKRYLRFRNFMEAVTE